MGWHPCWHHTCCENYHGQCYGGGCDLNPGPGAAEDDRDEREDEDEDEDGDDEADGEGGEK